MNDMTNINELADALRSFGFEVGPRDVTRNQEFAGRFMVADESYCIVGDDLSELIEDAARHFEIEASA